MSSLFSGKMRHFLLRYPSFGDTNPGRFSTAYTGIGLQGGGNLDEAG